MRPAKILVVDDEPHLVKLVRSNLEAQHFRVITAMDGPSGVAMVEKEGPDLIILDIMLPGMDALMLCKRSASSRRSGDHAHRQRPGDRRGQGSAPRR